MTRNEFRKVALDTIGIALALFMAVCSMFLLAGCSPAGEDPEVMLPFSPALSCAEELAPKIDDAVAVFPDLALLPAMPLRLTPDAEVSGLIQASAASYRARLGLDVEFTNDGIPVTMESEIVWKGGLVDGLARYERHCVAGQCSDPYYGVTIMLSEEAVIGAKNWGGQQTADHELGHVWSGWGYIRKAMHLPDGNLMAPGCRNRVCSPWTTNDALFICEAAPCGWINL